MGVKACQNSTDSPRAEVGEIDTRSPFESVKAAVSLFGEGAFSGSGEKRTIKKLKLPHTENVLVKETRLHLAEKELNKFKEQLKNAETTKIQVLSELEKAKRTVEDLTQKVKIIKESKELAIKATEAAKNQTKQLEEVNSRDSSGSCGDWKQELDSAREQYTDIISELDAAKQELRKIHQDFEASMEVKVTAFKLAEEAVQLDKANRDRATDISKEIATAQESLTHVKLASVQAQQEQAEILSDKDAQRQSYRVSLEETKKKLVSFKKEFDPEITLNLDAKLAETDTEIGSLQKEIENARASHICSVKTITSEIDDAKEALNKVTEEESSLRSLVESLKIELENVKKEHSELKDKEAEFESLAGNLHVKLRKSKVELEAARVEELKTRGASDELIMTLQQLSMESEIATREAEEMKETAEELMKEAETTRISLQEAEKKLEVTLKDVEEAKAAEAQALDRIKILSEQTNAARASTSESGAKITISTEEFESMNRKVKESEVLAEMKVAAAIAQVEAVKASENETLQKVEKSWKEIEEMKTATKEALKRAEMAEAARKAVEGELRRWREKEQKKAAEAAALIMEETKMSSESASPHHARVQKQIPPRKTDRVRKMEKTFSSKKVLLHNLSGIFHRKKNQVEGGSPSYLPGEKLV